MKIFVDDNFMKKFDLLGNEARMNIFDEMNRLGLLDINSIKKSSMKISDENDIYSYNTNYLYKIIYYIIKDRKKKNNIILLDLIDFK